MNAVPLTALDTFRAQAQQSPWWFWGMAGASGPTAVTGQGQNRNNCRPIIRQYGWQAGDAVSRTQIAQALVTAEDLVREHLGYSIAPQFREATLPWPQLADRRLLRTVPLGSDGRWLSVTLPEGEIRAVGVETITVLEAAVPQVLPFPYIGPSPAAPYLVYRDLDGDGLVDQVEIGITDSSTPLDQIAVFVSAADRFDGTAISARWQLRPFTATRTGSTVVLRGPAWVMVQPVRYEGANAAALNGLDPADSTIYLAAVDVARYYAAPGGTTPSTAQAELIWESQPWPWCACPVSTSDPASTASAVARVGIRDAELGLVTPAEAVYDASTGLWAAADCFTWWGCRPPDRVTVRYQSGLPLVGGQVAPPWDRLITGMAAASLGRPLAGCEDTASLVYQWQTDVTRAAGGTTFQAQRSADNPFGPRRGQIDAWQAVYDRALRRGVTG
jgi:hypothetical protein